MRIRPLAAFCTLLSSLTAAGADEFQSVYTRLDLDDCLILSTEAEVEENQGAEWVCAGHDRIVVWVAEGDLRYFLGYGSHGRDQCSYRQTLGPFHTVHTALEWRLRDGVPIATILRYVLEGDGRAQQYLVVTKLGDGQACQMAYVDASTPDANRLAQEAADRYAPGFDCATDRPFAYSAAGKVEQAPFSAPACSN